MLAELTGVLHPSVVSGDWRARVLEARVALLAGDLQAAQDSLALGWTGGWIKEWKYSVELEVRTCLGQRKSAWEARAKTGVPPAGWEGPLANTLTFLGDGPPTASPTPEYPDGYYPFPWRAEEPTRVLIAQGWQPGQPLIEALDRGREGGR